MKQFDKNQKIQLICHIGRDNKIVNFTYETIDAVVDESMRGAVRSCLQTIADDNYLYKSISANYNGKEIQVNLLD